ncbi:hypothetical protein DL766_010330 [Monosporascus sp. MC13-8B]|uniref:Uncharacterized protein n=1 Tax=Monosporascus cannonballus TaxID=155416 RepID=A0ABY0GXF3_9PEZI|nr:hypothetical protein DL762_009432 [Monosporascus cannonballus]RYO79084.1 hypothetical protein DL763_009425 [Monosporascus cannonballus]RYP02503.1 hypothetical protein DL766_010330 [Monosporascus sp. MC13-8B]
MAVLIGDDAYHSELSQKVRSSDRLPGLFPGSLSQRIPAQGQRAITLSHVTWFLTFCDKYGHAPPRTVRAAPARPEVSYFEITLEDDGDEPADCDPLERYRELAADDDDDRDSDGIPTLEFDRRGRRELERRTWQLEEAKEQHGALDTAAGRRPPRPGGAPELQALARGPRGVQPQVGGFRVSERGPAVPAAVPPDGWGKKGLCP